MRIWDACSQSGLRGDSDLCGANKSLISSLRLHQALLSPDGPQTPHGPSEKYEAVCSQDMGHLGKRALANETDVYEQ